MSRASNLGPEKAPKLSLVASSSSRAGEFSSRALKHVVPLKRLRTKRGDEIVVFLLKVAALEAIRRLSRSRCPVLWRVVQGLQVLGCPPFKWVQRWQPLGFVVRAVQVCAFKSPNSVPIFVLSTVVSVLVMGMNDMSNGQLHCNCLIEL